MRHPAPGPSIQAGPQEDETSASAASGSSSGDAAVAIVSLYQKQQRIYPRAVSGWFAGWRWAFVWATQILFYGLPWLEWHSRQAVLFDLSARRFYIFSLVLYPQDFIYLTGLLIVSAYALFLFTAVAGRLWCGFSCPQTVYTEIFLWIEQRIEGDRIARMKLDAGPWTARKLARKSAKHAAWIAFGLWTGFTFVGYFTPIKVLADEVLNFGLGPWEWFWVLFYGLATYGNAGFLREQVCKYMCPYARFQSAMFDKDTLIISYDEERGEPRGSRSRKADPKALALGDCIDCTLCVQVCPTGIDIRQGLQYECIGCAACVDVCDSVMDKMNYPRGLVRYATQNGLAEHLTGADLWRRVFRPRVLIYSSILFLILAGLGTSLLLRSPFRVDVVRDRATLARLVDDGQVENVYRLQLMNASEQDARYRISIHGLSGIAMAGRQELDVGPAQAQWMTTALRLAGDRAANAGPGAHPVTFRVESIGPNGVVATVDEKSTFVVPR